MRRRPRCLQQGAAQRESQPGSRCMRSSDSAVHCSVSEMFGWDKQRRLAAARGGRQSAAEIPGTAAPAATAIPGADAAAPPAPGRPPSWQTRTRALDAGDGAPGAAGPPCRCRHCPAPARRSPERPCVTSTATHNAATAGTAHQRRIRMPASRRKTPMCRPLVTAEQQEDGPAGRRCPGRRRQRE